MGELTELELEKLKFPIGKFQFDVNVTSEQRQQRIDDLQVAASRFRVAVEGLTDEQLDTPYRPGGWTARQVVHHAADAAMNLFTRAKLALTEDKPLVKTFEENDWVKLIDSEQLPVESSLLMLEGIHIRVDALLRSLSEDTIRAAGFTHPDSGYNPLDRLIAYFDWHGRQHAAHITSLRERMGW